MKNIIDIKKNSKFGLFFGISLILITIIGIMISFYYYYNMRVIKYLVWLMIIGIMLFVFNIAHNKKIFSFKEIKFFKEVKLEFNKIIWANKNEIIKMTTIVAILVCLVSIILWSLDSLLLLIIGWCMG